MGRIHYCDNEKQKKPTRKIGRTIRLLFNPSAVGKIKHTRQRESTSSAAAGVGQAQ